MHKSIKNFANDMVNQDYEHFDVSICLDKILRLLDEGVTKEDIKKAITICDDEDLFYEIMQSEDKE